MRLNPCPAEPGYTLPLQTKAFEEKKSSNKYISEMNM